MQLSHGRPALRHDRLVLRHGRPVLRHDGPVLRYGRPVLTHGRLVPRHSRPVLRHGRLEHKHDRPVHRHSRPMLSFKTLPRLQVAFSSSKICSRTPIHVWWLGRDCSLLVRPPLWTNLRNVGFSLTFVKYESITFTLNVADSLSATLPKAHTINHADKILLWALLDSRAINDIPRKKIEDEKWMKDNTITAHDSLSLFKWWVTLPRLSHFMKASPTTSGVRHRHCGETLMFVIEKAVCFRRDNSKCRN